MAFKKVGKEESSPDSGPHVLRQKYMEILPAGIEHEDGGIVRYIGLMDNRRISVVNSRNGMGFVDQSADGQYVGKIFVLIEHDEGNRHKRIEDADGIVIAWVTERDGDALVRWMDGGEFEAKTVSYNDAVRLLGETVNNHQFVRQDNALPRP